MNPAHLHLMLNHLPVVGLLFALSLLAWGMLSQASPLLKAGLVSLVAVALLAIPAYLSGDPAEDVAEALPSVTHAIIEEHEEAAKIAFAATLVTGVAALAALVIDLFKSNARWTVWPVIVVALLAAGTMAWTANLGGMIRHTEIRNGAPVPDGHDD